MKQYIKPKVIRILRPGLCGDNLAAKRHTQRSPSQSLSKYLGICHYRITLIQNMYYMRRLTVRVRSVSVTNTRIHSLAHIFYFIHLDPKNRPFWTTFLQYLYFLLNNFNIFTPLQSQYITLTASPHCRGK